MKRLFNEISGKLVNYHSFGPHGGCSAIRLNSSNCQGRAGSTRLNGLQVQISITLLAKWDLSNIHQLRFLPLCSLWATAWQKLCSQENIWGVWTALGWLGASVADSLSTSVFLMKCPKGDVGVLISNEYWIKNDILGYGALLSSSYW